jgi:hypothetical protein
MFASRPPTSAVAVPERLGLERASTTALSEMLNAAPRTAQLVRTRQALSAAAVVQRMEDHERTPFIEAAERKAQEAGLDPAEVQRFTSEARYLSKLRDLSLADATHRLEIEFQRVRLRHEIEQKTQQGRPSRQIADDVAGIFGLSVDQIVGLYVDPFRDEYAGLPPGFEATVTHWADLGVRDVEATITDAIGEDLVHDAPDSRKYRDQLDRYISANIDFARFYGRGHEEAKKYIHFIWSGRPISQGALANVLQWAERAKNTPWQVVMWSDGEISNWVESASLLQRSKVKLVDVKKIVDPRFAQAYEFARQYNLAGASDLVRLSILKRHGGMYVDVDIGPGTVDLANTTTPPPLERPRLAPGIRDAQGVRDLLGLAAETPVTEQHVKAAARRQRSEGVANNNFISSAPNPLAINPIINHVAKAANAIDADSWPNSGGFIAGISGPMAIGGVLDRMEKRGQLPTSKPADTITGLPLTWLTPDSEDQQWSH